MLLTSRIWSDFSARYYDLRHLVKIVFKTVARVVAHQQSKTPLQVMRGEKNNVEKYNVACMLPASL